MGFSIPICKKYVLDLSQYAHELESLVNGKGMALSLRNARFTTSGELKIALS
jgi:hypothetical protein